MKGFIPKLFLSCFLLLVAGTEILLSQQQPYIITRQFISVEDGLASREVLCGLQDSKGFVWLGTRNGLNRYDGKNFLLFTRQHNGLQDNKVIYLVEDSAADLWIEYGKAASNYNTSGKVDILNLETHEVKSLTAFFKQLPFKESDVEFIVSDGKKGVVIGTHHDAVWKYSPATGFRKWLNLSDKGNDIWFGNVICKDSLLVMSGISGGILYATPDSIIKITSDTLGTVVVSFDSIGRCIIFQLKKRGGFIYTTLDSHGKLTGVSNAPYPLNRDSEFISTPFYDVNTGNNVLQTSDGILYFDGKHLVTLVDAQYLKPFNGMQVHGYFSDKLGKHWIYTSTGVFIVKAERNKFAHYFTTAQIPVEGSNQARGIYADTIGNVYTNIWNMLYVYKFNDNISRGTNPHNALPGPLLFYDDTLLVVIGARVDKYNPVKNTWYASSSIKGTSSWSAWPLPGEKILIAGTDSIYTFNLLTGNASNLCPKSSFPPPVYIYRFFKSRSGQLWAAGEGGLYIVNEGCITDYFGRLAKEKSHQLPYSSLNDAHEDKHGIFWLATNGEGLYRWDRKNNSFRQFSLIEGFSSNIMYRIEEDENDNLWISTDYGLARFNTNNFSVYTYTTKDGISHNEFNRISSFKAADGRMYFGGLNGVNAFYPKDFLSDTSKLNVPLRITAFSQFDAAQDKLLDKTILLDRQNEITVQPGDRFFNLEFRLLDYENESHRYAYMIEGLDKHWTYISENSIRVSGLPYGKFTLRVRGQNLSGQWSRQELKIPVLVIRPFYERGWFFVLVGITIMASIYAFVFFRTRQLEKDNIKLEDTVAKRTTQLWQSLDEKDALLKEIHHRVKNNLQTISSLLDLQSRNIDDEKAKSAIQEGQNRVRSIALIHQNLYQHENLAAIEFGTFMNELSVSIKDVFLKKGDEFEFINNIPKTYLDIDTAVPLGLIANELLTNAFKYAFGNKHQLQVKANLKNMPDGNYIFELRDNGPGLPLDFNLETAKSLGIRLVSRLSEQLGGEVKYHYDNGSVFSVFLKDTEARKREE